MASLIPIGNLVAATDTTTAASIRKSGSASQGAVDDRIGSVAADIISTDPSVVAEAALLAQSDAGLVKKGDPAIPRDIEGEDIEVVADADSKVIARRTADGRWVESVTIDAPNVGHVTSIPGYSYLHRADSGQVMEDSLDESGQVLSGTLNRWRDYRAGDLGLTSTYDIACAGDSMTDAYGGVPSYPSILQGLHADRMVYELGVTGQTSSEIAFRMWARTLTGVFPSNTIPASGTVTITIAGWLHRQAMTFDYPAEVMAEDGTWVAGTLTNTSGVFTWTRTEAGASATTALDGAPILYDGPDRAGILASTLVLWPGRNNIAEGDWTPETLIRDIRSTLQAATPGKPRFLILPIFTYGSEHLGDVAHTRVLDLNAAVAAEWPENTPDARRFLVDHGITDAGLTPTATDTQYIDDYDTTPPSLQHTPEAPGSVHLNAAGRGVVARFVNRELSKRSW